MPTETIVSLCPATGEVVWSCPAASREEVISGVNRAREAFPSWRALPVEERAAIARRYAGILKERSEAIATLIARETGKPIAEARQEVASMIGKVEISIAAQAERAGERRSHAVFCEMILRHKPHGVMAVIGPYNFPGHLPNGHIVPALLAGNVVVFKPSELTPAVGEAIINAWQSAGLPDGVLVLVQGSRETGQALIDAEIDGLLFTGSAATGMYFRRYFAERPEVVLALELGGNNPLVVWDGDIDEAAALIVHSAFVTTGQRCSCARRLILPEGSFGDSVVDAVTNLATSLRVGRWDDTPAPFMGPLVSEKAAATARSQVQGLIARGAHTILPFEGIEGRSPAFVTPALFDVTGVAAPDIEIFAPVLQIYRVGDFDTALAVANDTRFGLAAGLVSSDNTLWQRFVLEVRAGVINRNRPTTGAASTMPFGGLGQSGNHRPSAFYAADYCAYPVASFEAEGIAGNFGAKQRQLR